MRLRQPHLQRHHARLRAEAEDDEECRGRQGLRIAGELSAAGNKREIIALGGEKEEAQQRQRRAEGRVPEVGEACPPGLLGAVMQHQRHGAEGHELKAHVERLGVCRKGEGDEGRVGQQEEAEELAFLPLVLHVAEGVELDKAPDKADQGDEEEPQPVRGEGQRQGVAQVQKGKFARKFGQLAEEGRGDSEDRSRDHAYDRELLSLRAVRLAEDQHRADHGEQE